LSYAAESLAHALFPGLVLAALVGAPLGVGAAAGLLVAGAGIVLARRSAGIDGDTAVGVVVTGLVGLGAALALSAASPPGLDALLFGDILGVSNADLVAGTALLAVVALVSGLAGPRLLAVGLDRAAAGSLGIGLARIDGVLLGLLAATTLVAVQGLGSLLVLALVVGPPATARRLTGRLAPMMAAAAAIGLAAGVGGLYVSWYVRTAAGPSIAALSVAAYVAVEAAGALRRRRLGRRYAGLS
jgi:ABC-type Mn2+/Zn2+ transport system permease subunit